MGRFFSLALEGAGVRGADRTVLTVMTFCSPGKRSATGKVNAVTPAPDASRQSNRPPLRFPRISESTAA